MKGGKVGWWTVCKNSSVKIVALALWRTMSRDRNVAWNREEILIPNLFINRFG